MILTKALVLKGVIGATSVVLPASLMVAYRKEISSYFNPSNLTEFDQGLIDYLDAGGDIKFKVTKGTTDLTESDLVFSEENLTITTQVKVSVSEDSGANAHGTLIDASGGSVNEKAKKSTLQKLNGSDNGTAWTWICEIQLIKETGNNSTNSIKSDIKNRILKNNNEGLFGILSSELGSDNKKESNKTTKKDFIKKCAEARENNENFSMTNNNHEIKTPKERIEIKFKKETNNNDLTPTNTQEFDKWFPQIQSDAS